MTLNPARLGRRTSMRSLRHHAARVNLLSRREAAPVRPAQAVGLFRAWLHTILSAFRSGRRARHVLLRKLLRRASARRLNTASPARAANRRPRRLSASAGWFAFAAR